MTADHYLLKLVSCRTGKRCYASLIEGSTAAHFALTSRTFAWRFKTAAEARGALKDPYLASRRSEYVVRVVAVGVTLKGWSCPCWRMATELGDDNLRRCVGCGRH